MRGEIFKDAVRDGWKSMLGWGIGMGMLGFFIVALMQDSELLEQYSKLLSQLPPVFLQFMGASDAAMFTSVEGYIGSLYVSYAMLMLSVYAVIVGLNITANDEDEGILDVFMSLPIKRQDVIIEKYAAFALISVGVVAFCFILPAIAMIAFNVEVNLAKIFVSVLTIYPGLLFLIAITALVSVVVRRKMTAVGIVTGFIVASYFLNLLGGAASESILATLRGLSIFYYSDGQSVILDTFSPLGLIAVLLVSLVLVGLSITMFERRDIGV